LKYGVAQELGPSPVRVPSRSSIIALLGNPHLIFLGIVAVSKKRPDVMKVLAPSSVEAGWKQ
jgi:hypothetical protein